MYFNKDDSKILRKIDDILTVIKRKCILKVVFLTKKCNYTWKQFIRKITMQKITWKKYILKCQVLKFKIIAMNDVRLKNRFNFKIVLWASFSVILFKIGSLLLKYSKFALIP